MKKILHLAGAGAFFALSLNAYGQCVSISCPANITANTDPASCGAVINYPTPVGTNTCVVSGTQTFNYTGSLQTFTVPAGVTMLTIDATGAQGGSVTVSCAATGGLGARIVGDVAVTPGEVLTIMVGQQGLSNGADAGGGGGTFVARTGNVPLICAGGGGGATNNIGQCGANRNGINASITTSGTASGNGLVAGGTNGNGGGASNGSGGGGGGFYTDGIAGIGLANNNGKAFVNGGAGGTGNNNDFGGYGGGGAGWFTGGNGGGGGGYSGGGTSGSQPFTGGGGGGSFNSGTNQTNTAGFQTGNGRVIISYSVAGPAITTQTAGLPSGSLFPVGTTTCTFLVTDGASDSQSCSFTVTVTDNEAPVITCGTNVSVATDAGQCSAVVNYPTVGATDNCSATVTQLAGLPSGSAFPVGVTTNVFAATDAAGNIDTCMFTVTVIDTVGPVFTCPANVVISNDSGQCGAVVNYTVNANDPCNVSSLTLEQGLASGSLFPVGTTLVEHKATDANGNETLCSFTVTVNDAEAPVLTCPSNVTSCSGAVTGLLATANDNCDASTVVSYTLTGATTGQGTGDASGTFNVGVTTIAYSAADSAGNSMSCTVTVTINALPTVTASAAAGTACLSDANVALTGTPAGGTWSGPGVSAGSFSPSTAGVGTHNLIYAFTDANGCSNADTVAVTVNACTGVAENSVLSGVNVFPNPMTDNVTIAFGNVVDEVLVTVVQINGQVVRSIQANGVNRLDIPTHDLSAGIYFVNITSNGETRSVRVVK